MTTSTRRSGRGRSSQDTIRRSAAVRPRNRQPRSLSTLTPAPAVASAACPPDHGPAPTPLRQRRLPDRFHGPARQCGQPLVRQVQVGLMQGDPPACPAIAVGGRLTHDPYHRLVIRRPQPSAAEPRPDQVPDLCPAAPTRTSAPPPPGHQPNHQPDPRPETRTPTICNPPDPGPAGTAAAPDPLQPEPAPPEPAWPGPSPPLINALHREDPATRGGNRIWESHPQRLPLLPLDHGHMGARQHPVGRSNQSCAQRREIVFR